MSNTKQALELALGQVSWCTLPVSGWRTTAHASRPADCVLNTRSAVGAAKAGDFVHAALAVGVLHEHGLRYIRARDGARAACVVAIAARVRPRADGVANTARDAACLELEQL
eukprot:scaffold94610_cov72-Phaeocystis_antarctica.AAC.2